MFDHLEGFGTASSILRNISLHPIRVHGIIDTMRVIAKRTLRNFWEKHSSAKQPLLSWYKAAQTANWQNSAEFKEQFTAASIINATRVVFNIGGNKYRLICIVRFDKQLIFIRFIGTHKEYDKLNAAEV